MSDSKECPHGEWPDEYCIDCLQQRIAELEAEVERLRKALANLIQYGDRIVAHQALIGEY